MQLFIIVIFALAYSAQASHYPASEPIVTYHEEPTPVVLQKTYTAPTTYIHQEPSYSQATVSAYTYSIHHPQPATTHVVVPQVEYRVAPVLTRVAQPAPVVLKAVEQPHVEYGLPAVAATRFVEPVPVPHEEYNVPIARAVPQTTYGVPNF